MRDKKEGVWYGYRYLCNWAVAANWKKTDITNKRVTCKNCKRAIKKFNKYHPNKNIILIKEVD